MLTNHAPTPAQPANDNEYPLGARRSAASATTRIDRKDFGVSWNAVMDAGGFVVSDTVDITLELELVRKRV